MEPLASAAVRTSSRLLRLDSLDSKRHNYFAAGDCGTAATTAALKRVAGRPAGLGVLEHQRCTRVLNLGRMVLDL